MLRQPDILPVGLNNSEKRLHTHTQNFHLRCLSKA